MLLILNSFLWDASYHNLMVSRWRTKLKHEPGWFSVKSHMKQLSAQVLWDLMIIKAKRGKISVAMREALRSKVSYKWNV